MFNSKLYLILVIGLSFAAIASTQDSLQNLLTTELHDTSRIDLLEELSKHYRGVDLDTSIRYAEQATELARNINDKVRLGYNLKNIGIGYYYKGDFVTVLDYWSESLATFESIDDPKGISNLLSNIGAVYNSTGDYPKAVDYHLQTLRIAEKNNDDFRKATALQNIGAVYSNMEEFGESKKYYEEAIELCKILEYEKGIGIITMNLSEVFRHMGDYEMAANQIEDAKRIFKKLKDPSLPEAMIASAHLHVKQNEFSKSIQESKEAYELAMASDSKVFMQRALIILGQGYLGINNPQRSKSSFEEALELSASLGVNVDLQEVYKGLKKSNQNLGNLNAALIAQDSLLSVSRQLYDIEKNAKISNLTLSFDLEKKESEIAMLNVENEIITQQIARANLLRNFLLAAAGFLVIIIGGVAYLYSFARKTNRTITEERNKSDQLLLNILPKETADELKEFGSVKAKKYNRATVLFTDFVNFTGKSGNVKPEDLVKSIGYYFTKFDEIIGEYNMEKIKTIGDAYMCVGGLPKENSTNAMDAINAAGAILKFVEETRKNPPPGITAFEIRIGINTGPLVAGVVGTKKFQYDIWGDAVNIAARMESSCEPNHINVSENVFDILKDDVSFSYRGELDVKNKGKMKMYYLKDFSVN